MVLQRFPPTVSFGLFWKIPAMPLPEQPFVTEPAPMSDETTAMCTFGRPPGRPLRTFMKVGKFRTRLACDLAIDDELSTRKRMSMSRFTDSGKVFALFFAGFRSGISSDRAVQAQSAGSATARPVQLRRRRVRDLRNLRPVM